MMCAWRGKLAAGEAVFFQWEADWLKFRGERQFLDAENGPWTFEARKVFKISKIFKIFKTIIPAHLLFWNATMTMTMTVAPPPPPLLYHHDHPQ
jgi:hypothetical protein